MEEQSLAADLMAADLMAADVVAADVVAADVVIIGCGPVGAALAIMLGRHKVRVLVIDKAQDIFQGPRAIVLDNDALRILQSIGVGEAEFAQVRIPHARLVSPIFGEFARVNLKNQIDTQPMMISFFQPDLERALRRRLSEQPSVSLRLGVEFMGLEQTADGVLATLRDASGAKDTVKCRYLVGADGANSRVRKAIDLDFKGRSFAEDWLIVDALSARDPIDHVEFICDPARPTPHMVAPNGRQRWEFMLLKGETREEMEGDAAIDRLLQPWGGLSALTVERRAVYRFHARCVDRFSSGRVFLVGDAAHITPPFVGQGLVSGLRDAANLGWKLGLVVENRARPGILDSYDAERRPHARAMINLARFMGQLVMPRSRPAAWLVHGTLRACRVVPAFRRYFDDLGIKPSNRIRKGLFGKHREGKVLRPGFQLPQVWLGDGRNEKARSDDAIGGHLVLLGFGVDPTHFLSERAQDILRRLDARVLAVRSAASPADQCETLIDPDGKLLRIASHGTIALVRPDRFVVGAAPSTQAEALVLEAAGIFQAA